VADPGFGLRGGAWTLSTGGGGGRKPLKVLTVEIKTSFLACFCHISLKIMLKMNRERSERRKKGEN